MATNNKLHGAKRILSVITAALVTTITLSAMTVTSSAEDETAIIDQTVVDDTDGRFTFAEIRGATSAEWKGAIATCFAGGTGTQSSPYQIATGEQLAYLAQQVNNGTTYSDTYFLLTADILLNDDISNAPVEWTPIGGEDSSFNGSFNGNDHSVIGLYINDTSYKKCYMGLFGNNEGTISNVRVTDGIMNCSGDHIGTICGYSDGTISGCYTAVRITSDTEYDRYGGICGYNDSNGTIKNCTNTGELYITGGEYGYNKAHIGGICGVNTGTIDSCNNTGRVYTTMYAYYVGGVCGQNYSVVKNCSNAAVVKGERYVGGVCGMNNDSTMDCYNTGNITGRSYQTGGICGSSISSDESDYILRCYNTGKVTGHNYTGGICGYTNEGEIICCYNEGYVNGGSFDYIGGIIGYIYSSSSYSSANIENCYNTGDIAGDEYIAGIWGYCSGSADTISGCINLGNVSGTNCVYPVGEINAIIKNVYYDSNKCSTVNSSNYMFARTTAQLTADDALTTLGLDSEVWKKTANSIYCWYYPDLISISIDSKYVSAGVPTPTGMKAGAGNAKVQVKWNAVEGAESYRVMVWDGTKWTGYSTTATSYMVRNLTNGKKYAFAVKACANGVYGETSEIVYATPAASIIPTGVKAGAGDAKVQVKWNAVANATSYRVMVWDGAKWTGYSTASTSYMVRNLTNNKMYAFAVKAYVNGAYGATCSTLYAVPHNDTSIIPTGVKAGAGNAKVQVKWNTVYGASSYRVMVWDGTKWTGYTTTDTTYMVRNLTNGKKYAFVVKAYINGAYSANSTTVYATPNA